MRGGNCWQKGAGRNRLVDLTAATAINLLGRFGRQIQSAPFLRREAQCAKQADQLRYVTGPKCVVAIARHQRGSNFDKEPIGSRQPEGVRLHFGPRQLDWR
jgi:hypothetical protein